MAGQNSKRWLTLAGAVMLVGASGLDAAGTDGLSPSPRPNASASAIERANRPSKPQDGRLDWRVEAGRVDAQIDGWPLHRLLDQIATRTQWQIYVEPGLQHSVNAKFKDRTPGEALSRLLGTLSYALVPATNGPSRLYVFRTSAQTATELVVATEPETGRSRRLDNELIVTLKPGSDLSIEELAKGLKATVVGALPDLNAYRLRFADADAAAAAREALGDDEHVAGLNDNYAHPRPQEAEALAMNSLPAFNLKPKGTVDEAVVVGLIDTPVQVEGTMLKDFVLPSISVAGGSGVPADEPSHGTSMAETLLYTLAKTPEAERGTSVRILPIDVYGASGETTTFEIAAGIHAAIQEGATIVNLSLGGDTDSPLLRGLIQAGHRQGVVFVAAAGNEPVTTPTYPAAYPEVIAVTATTRSGEIASYANRGAFIDVAAPGTSVVAYGGRPYLVVGTSTATARVSGLAAGVAASTGKRGLDLEAHIRQGLPVGANTGP